MSAINDNSSPKLRNEVKQASYISGRTSIEVVGPLEGTEYAEINDKIKTYNKAVADYQSDPNPDNAQALSELAKALATQLITVGSIPIDILRSSLNQVTFSLVDLVFNTRIQYPSDELDQKSKLAFIDTVVELTILKAVEELDKQWDAKRAEDLREIQRRMDVIRTNESASFFANLADPDEDGSTGTADPIT